MRPLNLKLFRDLWQIKGQALAISMVIAAGVAMYIAYISTFQSLDLTQETYYQRFRFGDVFASLKRAPLRLQERIEEIPGVASVETRVVVGVNLDVAGVEEPLTGRLISIPELDRATLNDVFLRKGRYIEPDHPDEVLVTEGFALAHNLEPGGSVTAVINGRRRELQIVGIVLSPEYVYNIAPGAMMPDDSRFGLFWMEQKALSTAFDMEGGFNDVSIALMRGAQEDEVIDRLDALLEPYGGLGAIPRALQQSHFYLDAELAGLRGAGMMIPVIFLAVAAFLLNVVLLRIVAVQRPQIAALKALGYTNFEIGMHYTGWSLAVSLVGGAIGVVSGAWLGSAMTTMYGDFFRFPILSYRLAPGVLVGAVVVSVIAAVLGAYGSVKRAVKLPPAEAMRPEPPSGFGVSWVERLGLKRFLGQPARMILRNIQRRPWRTVASVIGISFGAAMMVVGMFWIDAMDLMMDVQYNVAQRQDMTVSFVEPASSRSLHEIKRMPGVVHAETLRSVPVRLRYGHRSRMASITGLAAGARLSRIINTDYRPVTIQPEGLVLSSKMGEILGVKAGDELIVEVLEGRRPKRMVLVTELVDEFLGTSAYMERSALHAMLREGHNLSGAFIQVDSAHADELYRRLKLVPFVAGVALKSAAVDSFYDTIGESLGIMIFFNVLFAGIIAFGVVYNAARISLSERGRELASLRVMGFTRGEISFILLGELALVTLISLPIGMALGYWLAALVVTAYDTEVYRFPLVVSPRTYAWAALTVGTAALISGAVVKRKLNNLDLVEVLKTRE
jgi:putative ABC transport system permease protein